MDEYTVEVITAPVRDDDWTAIHSAMDDIPGTVLLADPEAPTLLFPVKAESPLKAVQLVDGLATLIGLKIESGKVYPTPEWDADLEIDADVQEEQSESCVVSRLTGWVETTPPPPAEIRDLLVCA